MNLFDVVMLSGPVVGMVLLLTLWVLSHWPDRSLRAEVVAMAQFAFLLTILTGFLAVGVRAAGVDSWPQSFVIGAILGVICMALD